MSHWFDDFAEWCASWSGQAWYIFGKLAVFVLCCIAGWMLGSFSDGLLYGTAFLTVTTDFQGGLIQNTANRREPALQKKLDELIRSHREARNEFIGIEKGRQR